VRKKLKESLNIFHSYGYLPSAELLELIYQGKIDIEEIKNIISISKTLKLDGETPTIDYIKLNILKKQESNINWYEIDRLRVYLEKKRNDKIYFILLKSFLDQKIIDDYINFLKLKKLNFEDKLNFTISEVNKDNIKKEENKEEKEIILNASSTFEKIKVNNNLISTFKSLIEDEVKNKKKEVDEKDSEKGILGNLKESKKKEASKVNENETSKKEENKEENAIEKIKKKVKILVNYSTNKVEWVENDVKILKSYETKPKKVELADFLTFFRNKYKEIQSLLMKRTDVNNNLVSINNLTGRTTETIIGIVRELNFNNDKFDLIVEDLSGAVRVIVDLNKNPQIKETALNLVPDDVVAFQGKLKGKTFYAENVIYPDIANNHVKWLEDSEIKEDVYAIALSDVHVGSKLFLEKKFNKLIEWLNGKNNKLHGKIGYVLISGDLVDGIGVYPEQIEELDINSAVEQYNKFSELIEKFPSEINVIISPGNHDALRLAEPQPILDKDLREKLEQLSNVYLVSNPSWVLLREKIKVLIYHGYSYDYFINNIDHLRNRLSYDEIHKLMTLLLQKRHLVPTYGSAPIYPEKQDFLFIEDVPNFIVSGHVHKSSVGSYKGVKLLSSSCWQDRTPFQEKVGHNPDPGKVPLINLKDGKVKLLQF
jgi:DNA polymerase II small subunit